VAAPSDPIVAAPSDPIVGGGEVVGGVDVGVEVDVGVDVGGTKILAVAVDPREPGRILAEAELATRAGSAAPVLADIRAVVHRLAAAVAPERRRVGAIGVGLPGLVDRRGVLRVGAHLPGIVDLDLREALADLGVPLAVDNDGNCAGRAEAALGAGRGEPDVLYVGLGTGISCALILDGAVRRGAHGFSGEPGHATLVVDGEACACGRAGCWEAYASGAALGRLARRAAAEGRAAALVAAAGTVAEVRGEHVTFGAARGDPEASALLVEFAGWVALGLANLVAVLDPGTIVVGGSVSEVGDLLVGPVSDALWDLVLDPAPRTALRLRAAALGRRSGAIGAALLASEARAIHGR